MSSSLQRTSETVLDNITKPPEFKFGWGDKVFSFSGWGIIILIVILFLLDKRHPHIKKKIGRAVKGRFTKKPRSKS